MAGKVVKLEIGTIYQKTANGNYYFRYQINGQRKAVSLKTRNKKDAIKQAQGMIPIIKATTTDVISAHVKQARGLTSRQKSLLLANAWDVYSNHPERAMPTTVHQQISYKTNLKEFVEFVGSDILEIKDITPEITDKFAQYLRETHISVHTHNRKLNRLKKIFNVLQDYRSLDNPFNVKSLYRKKREEQEHLVRRISFSREQEAKLLEALDDDNKKVKNKTEIKIIYYLGMFTGQRLKDCVLLQWDKVDLNKRKIWVKQFKTGKEVTVPIASKLLEILIEAKNWRTGHYVL